MASDNLNRVFIKAYGKGRSAGSSAPAGTALPQVDSDPGSYVVRFDTATMPLVAPPYVSLPGSDRTQTGPSQPDQPHSALPSSHAGSESNQPPRAVSAIDSPVLGPSLAANEMQPWTSLVAGSTVIVPYTTLEPFKFLPGRPWTANVFRADSCLKRTRQGRRQSERSDSVADRLALTKSR